MREKFKAVRAEIDKLNSSMITESRYKEIRGTLKATLRKGEIDNKNYQKLLTPVRKESESHCFKVKELKSDFCAANFPFIVSYGEVEKVVEIIEGRMDIK